MKNRKIITADEYFELGCSRCDLHATEACKVKKFHLELSLIREIISEFKFKEDLKWMHPCYTLNGTNVLLVHCFKEYCAIMFFKGALINDTNGLLIQQTENVQSGRQMRFTELSEVIEQTDIIKQYIKEAIAIEKLGLIIEKKKTEDFAVPDELLMKFNEVDGLKNAFEGLTPGRQRGYLLFFAAAKQSKTRIARIEKHIPQIFAGIGLHD